MATNVLGTVYETLLCSPGMNESVKIDVKMNRKTVLLLNSVVVGSLGKDGDAAQELLKLVPPEDVEELKVFADECLKKAGLKELSEKMKGLTNK
ncbi:hypothetical protein [Mucilaginibacter sp. R-33]|uniref:hypothetical protein n=1 Tax=Mucilaginibacter sp. R-33 TaxID=3416711 RepID=UPI003CF8ED11